MLSLIIPAHDEETQLGATLAALREAAAAIETSHEMPWEIIVVDDASRDGTGAIAEAGGARVERVDLRKISAVRNAGARVARGDLFVFIDADTIVPSATLRGAVEAMQAGAAGGGARILFDAPIPLYARGLAPLGNVVYRLVGIASGCFTFCTRAAFEAAGGYDEELVAGEEAALSRRLKRQGRFVVLREPVTTSGRKLRTYSAREVLSLFARLASQPRRATRNRALWGILYDERRPDPRDAG